MRGSRTKYRAPETWQDELKDEYTTEERACEIMQGDVLTEDEIGILKGLGLSVSDLFNGRYTVNNATSTVEPMFRTINSRLGWEYFSGYEVGPMLEGIAQNLSSK